MVSNDCAQTPVAPGVSIERMSSAIADEVARGPAVFRPSDFWVELAELNSRQLREAGFGEFKRTINQNYFAFLPSLRDPQFRKVAASWLRSPQIGVLAARLSDNAPVVTHRGKAFLRRDRRVVYALYLAMLWEYAHRWDVLGLLDRLDEPNLGHPVAVRYRGHLVSEDLCNSVLELNSLTGDGRLPLPGSVIELGGGYGRLGWAYLQAQPSGRYISVDIAPALAVAQEYLTSLYPNLAVFRFRHFDGAADVREELDAAQLIFITPNQLEVLPPLVADAFVNVSSLHEMRPEQIARYLELVDRHTAGRFFTKQWIRSVNEADGVVITKADYPIPLGWNRLLSRSPHVQDAFFEELYLTRDRGLGGVVSRGL